MTRSFSVVSVKGIDSICNMFDIDDEFTLYVPVSQQPGMKVEEEEDNEDEDMGVAETYADYMPNKCE